MHLSNLLRSHLLPRDPKNIMKRQQTISSIGNQSTPLICIDFNETSGTKVSMAKSAISD